tara:strand:- start:310 stop:528 length:219 start_codon:yes stop_codon:yes gene_type:complete
MKDKGKMKMKITKGMMDKLIQEAELHMVGMFASGQILEIMENDIELFEASVPSIILDREYFRNEFDMVIGEA